MFERTRQKGDSTNESNKTAATADSCLFFSSRYSVQKQSSLETCSQEISLSERDLNMRQSLCLDRNYSQKQLKNAREAPLKESMMMTMNNAGGDFKK
jgi:hypothetical protein